MIIETCERLMDRRHHHNNAPDTPKFHAQIKGKDKNWACGDTVSEAIGELVKTCPERFGLTINHLGVKAR